MLVSAASSSSHTIPFIKNKHVARIVNIAIPIIAASALTAGMIACSVFAPIPFLVILGSAGTISVTHMFAVRIPAARYQKFFKLECERLRRGELPSVTAEEMEQMVRSMKFQSLLSKIMLGINAIFLIAPLCVRDYNDYVLLDRLIPQLEFYQKLIDHSTPGRTSEITVQLEYDSIKKQYKNADNKEIADLCQKEAKYRHVRTNYSNYSKAMLLLGLDKMLSIDKWSFNKFIQRDKQTFSEISRLAVMEELENELYLSQATCPPTKNSIRDCLEHLQGVYRADLSRADKEALTEWFLEDQPVIKDDHRLKPLYTAIKTLAKHYEEETPLIYKASKKTNQYLRHLQNLMPQAVSEALRIDPQAKWKIKNNDSDIYASVYRLCLVEEMHKGISLDDKTCPAALKAYLEELTDIEQDYRILDKDQQKDLRTFLVTGIDKSSPLQPLYKRIIFLTDSLIPFKVCNETLLRNALAKRSFKDYIKNIKYKWNKTVETVKATVFYIFP